MLYLSFDLQLGYKYLGDVLSYVTFKWQIRTWQLFINNEKHLENINKFVKSTWENCRNLEKFKLKLGQNENMLSSNKLLQKFFDKLLYLGHQTQSHKEIKECFILIKLQ